MEDDKFKPAYLSAYQYKFNHYKLLDLNQFIELVEHLNRTNKNRKIVLSNPRYTKKVSTLSKNQFDKINNIVDILDGLISNSNSIEPMFVRRCDALHLKKTVQAREYITCSLNDVASIKKVFSSAFNIGANYSIKNKASQIDNDVKSENDIRELETDLKKWVTFAPTTKPQEMSQEKDKAVDNVEKVIECEKEKKKSFFSSVFNRKNFKLKCIACTRSDTLASISSNVE